MEFAARYRWWPLLHVVVACAAIGQGVCLVLVWAANLALAGDAAAEGVVAAMQWLGWLELALSVLVVGGLAVGAWLHRPLWARGVAAVILGMALHWGWWLLDRRVDMFATTVPGDVTPELLARVELRLWTMLGVDALSLLLLVLGGVLLLWHRSARRAEPDAAGQPLPADATPEVRAARGGVRALR